MSSLSTTHLYLNTPIPSAIGITGSGRSTSGATAGVISQKLPGQARQDYIKGGAYGEQTVGTVTTSDEGKTTVEFKEGYTTGYVPAERGVVRQTPAGARIDSKTTGRTDIIPKSGAYRGTYVDMLARTGSTGTLIGLERSRSGYMPAKGESAKQTYMAFQTLAEESPKSTVMGISRQTPQSIKQQKANVMKPTEYYGRADPNITGLKRPTSKLKPRSTTEKTIYYYTKVEGAVSKYAQQSPLLNIMKERTAQRAESILKIKGALFPTDTKPFTQIPTYGFDAKKATQNLLFTKAAGEGGLSVSAWFGKGISGEIKSWQQKPLFETALWVTEYKAAKYFGKAVKGAYSIIPEKEYTKAVLNYGTKAEKAIIRTRQALGLTTIGVLEGGGAVLTGYETSKAGDTIYKEYKAGIDITGSSFRTAKSFLTFGAGMKSGMKGMELPIKGWTKKDLAKGMEVYQRPLKKLDKGMTGNKWTSEASLGKDIITRPIKTESGKIIGYDAKIIDRKLTGFSIVTSKGVQTGKQLQLYPSQIDMTAYYPKKPTLSEAYRDYSVQSTLNIRSDVAAQKEIVYIPTKKKGGIYDTVVKKRPLEWEGKLTKLESGNVRMDIIPRLKQPVKIKRTNLWKSKKAMQRSQYDSAEVLSEKAFEIYEKGGETLDLFKSKAKKGSGKITETFEGLELKTPAILAMPKRKSMTYTKPEYLDLFKQKQSLSIDIKLKQSQKQQERALLKRARSPFLKTFSATNLKNELTVSKPQGIITTHMPEPIIRESMPASMPNFAKQKSKKVYDSMTRLPKKFKGVYAPSVETLALGIRGKKPGRVVIAAGLNGRPIL